MKGKTNEMILELVELSQRAKQEYSIDVKFSSNLGGVISLLIFKNPAGSDAPELEEHAWIYVSRAEAEHEFKEAVKLAKRYVLKGAPVKLDA